jgi:DNA-binding NtrC family response regulator
MHRVAIGERHTVLPVLVVDDEVLAGRSGARLLITAVTRDGVEALARRVHGAGLRAGFPFVHTSACHLSSQLDALSEQCRGLLDDAAGGSLLINGVEEMPPAVQHQLIGLLAALEDMRRPSATVRLMSGTTESLLHRVKAGLFSERLFYQLNSIHLITAEGAPRQDNRPT